LAFALVDKPSRRQSIDRQKLEKRYNVLRRRAVPFLSTYYVWRLSSLPLESHRNGLSRGGEMLNPALYEPFYDSACAPKQP
jgi:hypothetical protein